MNKVMNLRRNGLIGLLEHSGLIDVSIHFTEWWNGEGFDFSINDRPAVSIHADELTALVAIGIATEYIDLDTCKEMAEELLSKSQQREEHIDAIRREVKAADLRSQITLVKE